MNFRFRLLPLAAIAAALFGVTGCSSLETEYDERPSDIPLDELEKLVTKRKHLDDKKVLEVCHAGRKTADEITKFIQ